MRLLFLAESLDPCSGWGAYARDLTRVLRINGTHLTALTADASSEGPVLPHVHASRYRWILAALRLRAWLLRHPHDVIHVAAEPYARLVSAFGAIPCIVTIHGTYALPAAQGPTWAVRAYERALAKAEHIVAVSDFTQRRIPELFRKKTVVIPNGVDPAIRDEPFDATPAHGAPLVLSVGALKPRKGFDRLIAGFAEFYKTHPTAELVIVGREHRPEVRNALASQANRLGVGTAVHFLGAISRPALLGWYRACDVFALTPVETGGSFEGFGLVYLEANVFGKPCVGSRNSGAESAITEGENGTLVDPNDPTDVSNGINWALTAKTDAIRSSVREKTWMARAVAYQNLYARND